MTVSDWVLIGTTLFLGTIAIFGPVIVEPIKRFILGPRLKLIYRHEPPLARKSGRRSAATGQVVGTFFDFHLRIENSSRWVHARRVGASLEGMWVYDASDKPISIQDFLSVRLRYDNKGTEFVDINPRRHIPWNLGYLPEPSVQQQYLSLPRFVDVPGKGGNSDRFYLDVDDFPFHQPNRFVPDKYGVLVSVYAENAKRVDQHFEISWTGSWQSDVRNVVKEIVITPVDKIT